MIRSNVVARLSPVTDRLAILIALSTTRTLFIQAVQISLNRQACQEILFIQINKTLTKRGFQSLDAFMVTEESSKWLNLFPRGLLYSSKLYVHTNIIGHVFTSAFCPRRVLAQRPKPEEAFLSPPCILGFHQSVIKTKNRNQSMNKVKNLGYNRWLIYKKPRQESAALFAEVCHQNSQSFVWRRHVCVLLRDTIMAAVK